MEAQENLQQVTTRNLQQWAAASQFENFHFKTSLSWMKRFKKNHRIRQRKITRYISKREIITCEKFWLQQNNFVFKYEI